MTVQAKKLNTIRNKHKLSLILLHGSQVDGKTHPNSDIDIAVVRQNRANKLDQLELIKDLAELFRSDKVDLSDITNADPLLLFAVTSRSSLVSGATNDYDKLQKTAFHKYADYQPFLVEEGKFVKQRIKTYVSS